MDLSKAPVNLKDFESVLAECKVELHDVQMLQVSANSLAFYSLLMVAIDGINEGQHTEEDLKILQGVISHFIISAFRRHTACRTSLTSYLAIALAKQKVGRQLGGIKEEPKDRDAAAT